MSELPPPLSDQAELCAAASLFGKKSDVTESKYWCVTRIHPFNFQFHQISLET